MDYVLLIENTGIAAATERATQGYLAWSLKRAFDSDFEEEWSAIERILAKGDVKTEDLSEVAALQEIPNPGTDSKWVWRFSYGLRSVAEIESLPPGIARLVRQLELLHAPPLPGPRGQFPRTTGIIGRKHLAIVMQEAPAAIEHERNRVAQALGATGAGNETVARWLERSRASTEWVDRSSGIDPGPIAGMGSFLAALWGAAKWASERNADLLLNRESGLSISAVDWPKVRDELARRDRRALRDRVDHYVSWRQAAVEQSLRQEMKRRTGMEIVAERTPPSDKIELDDDEELFGHYLLRRLGLPLAEERGEGYEFTHELTPTELERLGAVLAEVAGGHVDPGTMGALADEFGYSDETARMVVCWFADQGTSKHVKLRKKLGGFVETALSGKKKLLFLHKEE